MVINGQNMKEKLVMENDKEQTLMDNQEHLKSQIATLEKSIHSINQHITNLHIYKQDKHTAISNKEQSESQAQVHKELVGKRLSALEDRIAELERSTKNTVHVTEIKRKQVGTINSVDIYFSDGDCRTMPHEYFEALKTYFSKE